MDKAKYLLKNLNLMNIILIGIVASFVSYAILPLRGINVKYVPSAPKGLSSSAADEKEKHEEIKPPSPNDYNIVAEQNLFHPERKIPVPKVAAAPLPKPDFVLYGTLITDDLQIAYMEDKKVPQSTPGRGKRQTAVRQGDLISGFILKQIEKDSVVMTRGDETLIVQLKDTLKVRDTAAVTATAAQPQQPTSPPVTVGRNPAPPAAAVQPQVSGTTKPVPPLTSRQARRRGLSGAAPVSGE
jgi:type II secretory pathway component PulC